MVQEVGGRRIAVIVTPTGIRRRSTPARSPRSTSSLMASGSSEKLKLYSYWQSSCSHRVRFALNLKGLEYEYKAVNLLKGEQSSPDFVKVNPVKFVPALVDGDVVVSDSLAIILYLEEKYAEHPLLPRDLSKRALNYQIASIVASTIQPLHNLHVLKIIEEKLDAEQKLEWAKQHVGKGFTALEKLLEGQTGKYATGDEVFLADVFLAPQLYAGIRRLDLDMSPFPILSGLYESYNELPAFQASLPQAQPDAPANS